MSLQDGKEGLRGRGFRAIFATVWKCGRWRAADRVCRPLRPDRPRNKPKGLAKPSDNPSRRCEAGALRKQDVHCWGTRPEASSHQGPLGGRDDRAHTVGGRPYPCILRAIVTETARAATTPDPGDWRFEAPNVLSSSLMELAWRWSTVRPESALRLWPCSTAEVSLAYGVGAKPASRP